MKYRSASSDLGHTTRLCQSVQGDRVSNSTLNHATSLRSQTPTASPGCRKFQGERPPSPGPDIRHWCTNDRPESYEHAVTQRQQRRQSGSSIDDGGKRIISIQALLFSSRRRRRRESFRGRRLTRYVIYARPYIIYTFLGRQRWKTQW